MDLKKLIAKMDQIESKKILTESIDESVKDKATERYNRVNTVANKDANKSSLSIAETLLKKFGLSEAVANPYTGADAEKFASLTPQDQEWLTRGGGVPDINDPYILARAPNKGQPQAPAAPQSPSQLVNPDSQQDNMLAAQTAGMNDPVSGVAGVQGSNQQDNMLAAQTAGMNGTAPAVSQSAQPAKPTRQKDPNVLALQNKLIAAGAKIAADGIMGPKTQAAMKQFNIGVNGNTTPAGAGRGTINPPDASSANQSAQVAQRTGASLSGQVGQGRGAAAGPTASQMGAGNPRIAKIDAEIKRFSSNNNMSIPANKAYVASLNAKRQSILNTPASTPRASWEQDMDDLMAATAAPATNTLTKEDINLLRKLAGL